MNKKIDLIEFSRKGGNTTKNKYGMEHYKKITTAGGLATRNKYGKEYYSKMGKKSAEKRRLKKVPVEAVANIFLGKNDLV